LEWANRSGGYYDPFRGRLVNRGVWRKTTGERVELENATLVNEAGGVLELVAGSLYRYSGSAVLQNAGLVKKQSPNPNNPVSAKHRGRRLHELWRMACGRRHAQHAKQHLHPNRRATHRLRHAQLQQHTADCGRYGAWLGHHQRQREQHRRDCASRRRDAARRAHDLERQLQSGR
jgi:hypothetical protein